MEIQTRRCEKTVVGRIRELGDEKKNNNEKIAVIKFILYSFIFPLFSVPALQLLGVLPQSVMKATLSKLVEPQEQGNNQLKIK